MSECPIGKRLLAAAGLVRRGARLADIGTDHAYLPIYLLREGLIESAVCSDVNEGPLLKARENVERFGLSDRVELVLCSGAAPLCGRGITDYSICGMGGELIASIIDEAPELRRVGTELILQPMSKAELLRKYLFDSGFEIKKELYTTDEGKHYVCLLAAYTGERQSYSDAELYFGKTIEEALLSEDGRAYIEARLASLRRARDGKIAGGELAPPEAAVIAETENKIERLNCT